MKHDIFDFDPLTMTRGQRAWRVLFLVGCIALAWLDLCVWRPM